MAIAAEPVRLERGVDIVRAWKAEQKLYVKGNVGVSDGQLASLEQWLGSQPGHWAVLLVESAAGEQYTDAEGQAFQGVEAINHALGKGLRNQTAFGQQVHPRTQERDAACFALMLKDRKLSYFASQAQDQRGLGADRWNGRLDQRAVTAMRNGARVVDAVKDTVALINQRLEQNIVQEQQELANRAAAEKQAQENRAAAERAAREAARERAQAAVTAAARALTTLEQKLLEFKMRHWGLTGVLGRPDVEAWRAELRVAQASLEAGKAPDAQTAADAVRAQIEAHVRELDQYEADQPVLAALAARLEELDKRPLASAASVARRSARESYRLSRQAYDQADPAYRTHAAAANQFATVASAQIRAAQRQAAQRRALVGSVSFSAVVTLALIGLWLNRRRARVRREALALGQAWEKGLSEKNLALFELLDRRVGVIGDSAEEAARRYAGETLRLSRQIITDVDELFLMSACAGRVLQEAQALWAPLVVWERLSNTFLRRRWERALRLLRDEPLAFKPEDGLELIVRGRRTERDRLLGSLESYQPFTMSFSQLIEAFNERAARALKSMETIESSLASIGETLETIAKDIDTASRCEASVFAAAQVDRLFGIPEVFGQLLPAARAARAQAAQLGLTDPVEALRTPAARALEAARDALALTALVEDTRAGLLPGIRADADKLARAGIATQWVNELLTAHSNTANQLATAAVAAPAAQPIAQLRTGLAGLRERVHAAVGLEETRQQQSLAEIARATHTIDVARREMGAALGLPPGEVLRENGSDPTDDVAQASAQSEAALAALARGDTEAAAHALQAITTQTGKAEAIVDATRRAFESQPKTSEQLESETGRIAGMTPAHQVTLAGIQARYAPSVRLLGAGDPVHPEANGALDDNLEETQAHLASARELRSRSDACFRQARLLEAADLLRQVQGHLEGALHRLGEIREKEKRLRTVEAANAALLADLTRRNTECAGLAADPTAMLPTVNAYEQATQAWQRAQALAQASPADPFLAATQLGETAKAFDAMADQARCDRDVYEEAQRSLRAAAGQMADAEQLARSSFPSGSGLSPQARASLKELPTLAAALNLGQRQLGAPHGDWHALDAEADRLTNRAAACVATLRGEIERAQAVLAMLTTAAATVRTAGAWTGGYGVRIFGTPGSDLLSAARDWLARGDYDQARHQAESALRAAQRAVAQAEAEVRRRREEEQERLAQERRRREQEAEARRQSQISSSSWGGSNHGGGSSSFSSGSGVATSSW